MNRCKLYFAFIFLDVLDKVCYLRVRVPLYTARKNNLLSCVDIGANLFYHPDIQTSQTKAITMNLFILDSDPIKAAMHVYDSHAVKMPLEGMQMLCTNARLLGFDNEYMIKSTHANHPSTIWGRTSSHNFAWLVTNTGALFAEYTKRYGKRHAMQNVYETLLPVFDACCDKLESDGFVSLTPFALAMPDECKLACPVASYRKYYAHKAKQECDKLAVYNVLVKRGCNPRKPALRFVWQRGARPTWATFQTAQHEK